MFSSSNGAFDNENTHEFPGCSEEVDDWKDDCNVSELYYEIGSRRDVVVELLS